MTIFFLARFNRQMIPKEDDLSLEILTGQGDDIESTGDIIKVIDGYDEPQ